MTRLLNQGRACFRTSKAHSRASSQTQGEKSRFGIEWWWGVAVSRCLVRLASALQILHVTKPILDGCERARDQALPEERKRDTDLISQR